jgi:hypothetical protein
MPATPPTPSVRQTPTGRRIPDGFVTKITFASQPALGVWEVKVKPSGTDGGELIDITTMFNTKWRTMYPQSLQKSDEITFQAAIDPDAITVLDNSLVNHPDTITESLPDGSTEAFYGVLRKWEPSEWAIGEFPLVTLTVGIMNYDTIANLEQGPVLTQAGT